MIKFIRALFVYRELLLNLTLREIKARYKQSILGYFWIILNPFFQMLVMNFIFSKLIRIQNLGVPYNVFLYAGLLPWTFFVQGVASSMSSLIENSSLLKKIYFPREIFIASSIFAKLIDFLLASTVFALFLVFYKIKITFLILLYPLILLIQIIFSAGLGLILSAFNLFYRDIQYLMNLIFLLWFYLTPIIYPVEMMPEKLRFIFKINPMSVLINAYRRAVFGGGEFNYASIFIALLISVGVFELGYFIFKKLEGIFADIV